MGSIKTPRSRDVIAHMDDMASFSRGMMESVSKSFETLTKFAKSSAPHQQSTAQNLSPFSKHLKKRQSLYTMLSKEMTIKSMLVESGDQDSKLYMD